MKTNYCDKIFNQINIFKVRLNGLESFTYKTMKRQTTELLSYVDKMKDFKHLKEQWDEISSCEEDNEVPLQIRFDFYNLTRLIDKIDGARYYHEKISNDIIVSLISTFDYYLRSILKETCYYLDDKFDNKDVAVKYNEIKYCESVDSIKEYYFEKYLEGLFVGSHEKLFEEIKNRFGIENIKESAHYKDLIFIIELRNIIVHNDSKVSITFKNRMAESHIDYNKYGIIKDNQVIMTRDFLHFVFDVLTEISIYIAVSFAVHFNKRDKVAIEDFFSQINDMVLECIDNGHPNAAINIYGWLIGVAHCSSEKFVYTINKCVGLYKVNKKDEVQKIINELDYKFHFLPH